MTPSGLPNIIMMTDGPKLAGYCITCASVVVRVKNSLMFVSLIGSNGEHCFVYDIAFGDN